MERFTQACRKLTLHPHKSHQPPWCRQCADVPIQVQPVQTLHLQGDVSIQQFWNVRHVRDSTESRNYSLVGLRSKTSLDDRRTFFGSLRNLLAVAGLGSQIPSLKSAPA